MNYLITGGAGYIGRAFIATLDRNKDRVVVVARALVEMGSHVKVVTDFAQIPNDAVFDVVINLAGLPIDRRWSESYKAALFASRVDLTDRLIACLARLDHKPGVLLSASAIGYYGDHGGKSLDEQSGGIDGFTHRLCKAWEVSAQQAQSLGVRVCIMRFGVVLGRNSGFIKKVGLPFRLGLGGRIGSGKQGFSWVHIEDVLTCMHTFIANKTLSGAFNVVAPEKASNKSLTKTMALVLHRPALLPMPNWVVKLLFGQMGEDLLLKGDHVLPHRLEEIGFSYKYPSLKGALSAVFRG